MAGLPATVTVPVEIYIQLTEFLFFQKETLQYKPIAFIRVK
jgi:hypothetical protein